MSHSGYLLAFMVAIAVVMFGLGLTLTRRDFTRALDHRRVLLIALLLQIVLLPAVSYGLILLCRLPPAYAIGLMILAAAPGGITANLYTHLFHGNVAMSISLTAITALTSVLLTPLLANFAIGLFAREKGIVVIQTAKFAEVFAILLGPVLLGMYGRAIRPTFARRAEKPVKILGTLVLIVVVAVALVNEWLSLRSSLSKIGISLIAFNAIALILGYYFSRVFAIDSAMAVSVCYQSCVRNTTIPMFVAINVLGSVESALPAAVYSILMHLTASLFGQFVLKKNHHGVTV